MALNGFGRAKEEKISQEFIGRLELLPKWVKKEGYEYGRRSSSK